MKNFFMKSVLTYNLTTFVIFKRFQSFPFSKYSTKVYRSLDILSYWDLKLVPVYPNLLLVSLSGILNPKLDSKFYLFSLLMWLLPNFTGRYSVQSFFNPSLSTYYTTCKRGWFYPRYVTLPWEAHSTKSQYLP